MNKAGGGRVPGDRVLTSVATITQLTELDKVTGNNRLQFQ